METLGETLAMARKARSWSLRDVEEKTGVHNAHLSQIETGGIARPDPNILWVLANLYDSDYEELMRLSGHIKEGSGTGASNPALASVAWRSLRNLSADEQRQVLDYIRALRKGEEP